MITYEYPFNERIRTLLRLEDLFEKAGYFIEQQNPREHHIALLTLFEILEVAGRADLKMDLIQELERQRQTLLSYRDDPNISEQALSNALYEIEQASTALLGMTGKVGYHLRENDWLMSIKSRAAIPGGVCEFDLPSYHFWQHKDIQTRRQNLVEWFKPMHPLRDSISIVLRFLKASGNIEQQIAKSGSFQLMLSGMVSQMVCISVEKQYPYIPEISANKYALNIRFSHPDSGQRHKHVTDVDIPFEIAFCNL